MASNDSNIAQFPAPRDGDREMLIFVDGYLQSLFYGNGWRSLARCLTTHGKRISPSMQNFVWEMAERENQGSSPPWLA